MTLANRWRKAVGKLPGVKQLTFAAEAAGGQGEPVNIQITAQQPGDLRRAADEAKAELTKFKGIYDIRDNLNDGQKEIKLTIKPRGEALGLTQLELGRQVRAAFFGAEAQRVQRERDDVRVMIRYPREERAAISNLENLRIRTPDGREVPFSEVAEAEFGLGYASILRVDRNRVVNVLADADKVNADLEAVKRELTQRILPDIQRKYPGLSYTLEGESKETADTYASLILSGALVMLGMYAMLAIPFKSYLQPVIIMLVIPFGLVGAVLGHVLLGKPLSMLSFFGIIALSGVVVNDSLVLVDYINKQRKAGRPQLEVVREGGVARFRAILLTSLTTFVGLLPILFEKSLQAQFLIPMAISLSFGIIFATFITLILVPAVYIILEDIKFAAISSWRWFWGLDRQPEVKTINVSRQT